ncbi:MAG: tRNA (5-methylaminomethyl-2-thiouridine)(34)-methyltransferase MnmD [Flavobacteriales bacterium]|nr:tRNA (5-methylaminomethyl-2-thiouridine)(34)-methyltransferase MnmD [Flavobacteriales bacterium]
MNDNRSRNIILTKDGSDTILHPVLNEHYHSIHGAIAESEHVFIKHGMQAIDNNPVNILEIGMGTGLNAFLTWLEAEKTKRPVHYVTLEPYPVTEDLAKALNYAQVLRADRKWFLMLHHCPWEKPNVLSPIFSFEKHKTAIQSFATTKKFHLIYFDAFSPDKVPEMWQADVFNKLYQILEPGGLLVTYCAKGAVKRTLQEVGFFVKKVAGPPGKREMMIAGKAN